MKSTLIHNELPQYLIKLEVKLNYSTKPSIGAAFERWKERGTQKKSKPIVGQARNIQYDVANVSLVFLMHQSNFAKILN